MKVIKGAYINYLRWKKYFAPSRKSFGICWLYLHVQVLPEIRKKKKKPDIVIISQEFKDIIQERFNQSDLQKAGILSIRRIFWFDGRQRGSSFSRETCIGGTCCSFFFFINTIRRILYIRRQFMLFNTLFPAYTDQPEKLVKDADYSDKNWNFLCTRASSFFMAWIWNTASRWHWRNKLLGSIEKFLSLQDKDYLLFKSPALCFWN